MTAPDPRRLAALRRPTSPPASKKTIRVAIIGAGLGGLCLAQGLRKVPGVEVAVYERDADADSRAQGYRISLKETGAGALRRCLPDDLYALCEATALRPPARMIFMDEQLTPMFAKDLPAHAGFGVHRRTLREILLADLTVHFGKTFLRYDETPGGPVRAHFADGTTAEADLLVGADGTNSAVRAQLLPDAGVDELHWAVYGRTPITDGLLATVPDVLVDTFNRVGTGLAVATCRTAEPIASAAARIAPRVRLAELSPYLQWIVPLDGPAARDAAAGTADAAALHRYAADLVRDWHPGVGRIIAAAEVAATFPVRVTSARPVSAWASPAVTLLGDAIHTMSPGRGDGANVALTDAAGLRDAIATAAAGRLTLAAAKATYETDMLEYGFAAVAAARQSPFAKR